MLDAGAHNLSGFCSLGLRVLGRHQIDAHIACVRADRLEMGLPALQLGLRVVQDIASLSSLGERLSHVSWHDGSVIKKIEQLSAVSGENDLLLGSLNRSGEVEVEGFLNFQASLCVSVAAPMVFAIGSYNIGQLGLGNQILRFSSDKLLLECDQSW